MIGYLRGIPLKITPGEVVLDVQGVGYLVHVPLSTFYELQQQTAGPLGLFVHTQVREDAIALFGFFTEREKQLFEKLISVSGVGPKLAQTALSGMSADDLVSALRQGDTARLSRIPGIGKKTAARLVVELKDKVDELATASQPSPTVKAAGPATDSELVAALVGLGYRAVDAQRAVEQVSRQSGDLPFAERLREALKLLSRV